MKFLAAVVSIFLWSGQAQPAPEGVIAGRLTNSVTGGAVRKARIVLTRSQLDGFTRSTTSDVNGRFAFAGLPAGRYRLSVRRDGFLPVSWGARRFNGPGKVLVLTAGEKRSDVNFALEPPVVISGRVLDEDAEPVPGVSVQALREDFSQGTAQYVAAAGAATNDLGEYRLFGLPPGKFYLISGQTPVSPGVAGDTLVYSSVFYPGAAEFGGAAALTMSAGGEARDIDLHVRKTSSAAVRGTLVNLPPGAERSLQVQIYRKDRVMVSFGSRAMGGFNATTAQFEFHGLTPGPYVIFGWVQDRNRFLYGKEEIEVGSADLNDLRLTMAPGVDISGTVKFPGEAARRVNILRVWLSRPEFYGPAASANLTADYSFTLNGVVPDSWRVNVSPVPRGSYLKSIRLGEQDALRRPVMVDAASRAPLEIVIGMGGTLSGTVRSPGDQPVVVEGATVLLVPEGDIKDVSTYLKTAVSDAEGHYEVTGIAPGTYRLFAFSAMEPMAYQDPAFLRGREGRGVAIRIAEGAAASRDLAIDQPQ